LLLGVRLKAHARVPLVCDFRDPWPTGFSLPPRHQRAALRRLRRYLVEHADLTLAVNQGTAKQVGAGVQVLDNGFDPTDFEVEPERLEGFSIVHVGNLWQNEALVKSFAEALNAVPEARLYLVGAAGDRIRQELARNPQVRLLGTVEHAKACALMKGADVLLYVGKPQQPAGIKLYEYLGAARPIVVWGDGAAEAESIVAAAGAGIACGTDAAKLAAAFAEMRASPARFVQSNRDRFNRRTQARWLGDRLEELVLRS
jgi:glycosyltransferase involved in cell wall biosynthesis